MREPRVRHKADDRLGRGGRWILADVRWALLPPPPSRGMLATGATLDMNPKCTPPLPGRSEAELSLMLQTMLSDTDELYHPSPEESLSTGQGFTHLACTGENKDKYLRQYPISN